MENEGEDPRNVGHLLAEETRSGERESRGREEEEEGEARLRLILDAARDYAIMLFDPDGRVTSWSPGAERLLGYSEAEILGRSGERFFIPEDRQSGAEARERELALNFGRAEDERWHMRKDGSRFYASGVTTPIWGNGRLVGFCKVMRDSTERMRAQDALRQSQAYFAALVESIDGVVWEGDADTKRHTFVSKKAEQLLGHSTEVWLKEFWTVVVYAEDRERVREHWNKAFGDKKGYTLDFRLVDAHGRKRWFRDYVSAVEQPGGRVKLRAVLVEVSAQKAVERRQEMLLKVASILAGSSSLAKAAGEILPIMGKAMEWELAVFWHHDRSRHVLVPLKSWSANPGCYKDTLKRARDQTLAAGEDPAGKALSTRKPLWLSLGSLSGKELSDSLREALAEGLRTTFACPVLLGDGALGAMEFFGSLDRAEEPAVVETTTAIGSQLGLFGERLKAEEALWNSQEQLRQSQKMEAIGRLAGGVAHDFNNLLTAINGYSDLLLSTLDPASPYLLHVEEISKAGKRAASLTNQLLAYSRKQVLAPTLLDLNTVMADMGRMLQRLLGEDIRLEVRMDPELRPVMMDPGQLEQVIMNLAVNARDAMPDGGTLTLETGNVRISDEAADMRFNLTPGEYVRFSVSDTGRGIDEAVMARLFEPFFTTKEAGKGTGLGLSMVYGIVQQSGGAVIVDSEPGRGATFTLYLPRAEAESPPRPKDEPPGKGRRDGRETILLVEDEEGVRNLAREILMGRGYTVLAAGGGDEALFLEETHPGPIHLVLTDFIMPGMNGREVYEALEARRPGIKVLYMSGYTEDAILRHGVETSGSGFLQKPFSPRVLTDKVHQLLKSGRPVNP